MHAANEKFNQEGWLECWTDLDANGFRYEIVSERGSDYIRERVLKTLLRREQELIAAGSAGRADISRRQLRVHRRRRRPGPVERRALRSC